MLMTAADLTPLVLAALTIASLLLILLLISVRSGRAATRQAEEKGRELRQRTDEVSDHQLRLKKAETALAEAQASQAAVEQRFSMIVDVEKEFAAVQAKIAQDRAQLEIEAASIQGRLSTLRDEYAAKRKLYDALVAQVAIFDERLALAEMGVYEPHFEFDDSDQYKATIECPSSGDLRPMGLAQDRRAWSIWG